jgi:hypothetical protein
LWDLWTVLAQDPGMIILVIGDGEMDVAVGEHFAFESESGINYCLGFGAQFRGLASMPVSRLVPLGRRYCVNGISLRHGIRIERGSSGRPAVVQATRRVQILHSTTKYPIRLAG